MAIPTVANTVAPAAKPGASRPSLIVATGMHANGAAGTGATPAVSAAIPRRERDEAIIAGTVNRADRIAIAAVQAIMIAVTRPVTATETAGVPAGTITGATSATGTIVAINAMPGATAMAAIRAGTIIAVTSATGTVAGIIAMPAGTAMAGTRPGIAAISAGTIMTIAGTAGGTMIAAAAPAPITTAADGSMPSAAAISIATGHAARRACTGCIT